MFSGSTYQTCCIMYTSFKIFCIAIWFDCQSGLVLLTDYNDYILLNKFRVTKISGSYTVCIKTPCITGCIKTPCITNESYIGSSFIRQKYFFCRPE